MAHSTDIGIRERRFFLLMIFLYLAIRWIRAIHFGPEFLHFYGGDILFVPILMTSVKIVKWLFNFSFNVNKLEVAIAVVYSCVVFEWLLPNEGTNFVSDPLDIAAYIFGALLYVFFISKGSGDQVQDNKRVKSIN
ncbi:hypothetical protein O3Q51_10340 [Cryomorphaceae bacterium 1068]|nr:hypothetical protein [Cryomorphaceae bacterium 1068]